MGERDNSERRIWGMTARELHDCFWASRGIQVVRQRHAEQPQLPDARLYLLLDPHTLVLFPAERFLDGFRWPQSDVVLTRVQHSDREGYQELATTDDDGRLLRFERCYDRSTARAIRIGVTRSRKLAALWHQARDAKSVWRFLRNTGYWDRMATISVSGEIYDAACLHEQEGLLAALVRSWDDPDSTIAGVRRVSPGVWAHRDAQVDARTHFIGPTWVGAGRATQGVASVLGPAVLWDEGVTQAAVHHPPRPSAIAVAAAASAGVNDAVVITSALPPRQKKSGSVYKATKRAFDVLFSIAALAVTLPFYPLVMLAIWLEDGGPFFFVHRRETRGGREFGCIKFRTMRKNAEAIKRQLDQANQCDGPQFFIERDPRVTRVGAFLRKYHVDEWPQFWNVLRGEMSVVGPRPSPFAENQYCPAWREARLSVRAGVTGLWQVSRTRSSGRDFREWIEFDVQYVQHKGWRMDFYVLWRTFEMLALPRRMRSRGGNVTPADNPPAPAPAMG